MLKRPLTTLSLLLGLSFAFTACTVVNSPSSSNNVSASDSDKDESNSEDSSASDSDKDESNSEDSSASDSDKDESNSEDSSASDSDKDESKSEDSSASDSDKDESKSEDSSASGSTATDNTSNQTFTVSFSQVESILQSRCINCHSSKGGVVEEGVSFDTASDIKRHVNSINRESVLSKRMPPNNNITKMTDEERQMIADWIKAGASGLNR